MSSSNWRQRHPAASLPKQRVMRSRKEIPLAAAATKNSLDALLSGTRDRLSNLTKENTAFGWVGWRGSREQEIQELLLFAHDIATTTANADLAFTRLKIKATALNKVALTCQ
jgi:hypothetical protein